MNVGVFYLSTFLFAIHFLTLCFDLTEVISENLIKASHNLFFTITFLRNNCSSVQLIQKYFFTYFKKCWGCYSTPSSTAPALTGSLLEGCKGCSCTLPLGVLQHPKFCRPCTYRMAASRVQGVQLQPAPA